MPMSEALKRAQKKYATESSTQLIMRLNYTADADIIEKLESVENKSGYIKDLIREDIRKEKES